MEKWTPGQKKTKANRTHRLQLEREYLKARKAAKAAKASEERKYKEMERVRKRLHKRPNSGKQIIRKETAERWQANGRPIRSHCVIVR